MFSGSKQRIFPLEDLPGTGHHPVEATALSCSNSPAGKWILATLIVQESMKEQWNLFLSTYAERGFILVMTGGRQVLKFLRAYMHSLLSLHLDRKKEHSNVHTVYRQQSSISFQKLTPFHFYAKFTTSKNISETAYSCNFLFFQKVLSFVKISGKNNGVTFKVC